MNLYLRLMRYEIKNIRRDKLTMTMVVYPIIMALLGAYLIPLIIDQFALADASLASASLLILIVLASLAPLLAGAMLGFLMLDHKDENTLVSLRVTPVSMRQYLTFKSIYTVLLSVFSSVVILAGVKYLSGDAYAVSGANIWELISLEYIAIFSGVSALFAPVFGLLVATLGKNKIEGFAYLKTLGILILVPTFVMLESMQDAKQYILGLVPTFWSVKGLLESAAIASHEVNLSPVLYFIIGTVYSFALTSLLVHQFIKRMRA